MHDATARISEQLLARSWSARPAIARGSPQLEAAHARWLEDHLDTCEDRSWARAFWRACPVPGAQLEDYQSALLEVGGEHALVSPRFMGGDISEPFVDVIAVTGPVAAGALERACQARYARLEPRRLRRVRWAPERAPEARATVDQHLLGERLGALPGAPAPRAQVELVAPEADAIEALSEQVARWYQEWAERAPWRRGRVAPADAEDLRACWEVGGVRIARLDGAPVALTAAAPVTEPTTGLYGWCMYEQVVAPAHARRGLGAATQRALAAGLARERGAEVIVYGTIDADNVGARATARSLGRGVLARLEFWPLEGASE